MNYPSIIHDVKKTRTFYLRALSVRFVSCGMVLIGEEASEAKDRIGRAGRDARMAKKAAK